MPCLAVLVVVAAAGLLLTLSGSHAVAGSHAQAPTSAVGGRAHLVHAATTRIQGKVDFTAHGVSEVAMPAHRAYLLEQPTGVTGALPLVVLLHGTDITAAGMMKLSGFEAMARTDHFLLVAPESVGPTWDSGDGCCGAPAAHHLDDRGFVAAVVSDVRSRVDVDPRRIYLVGYSAGGKLSYDVACDLGSTFAATATYGAGPQQTCADPVPHPVLVGYGLDDTLEPIAGKPHNSRGRHQPAALTVAQLRDLDQCSDAAVVTAVGPATIDRWSDCTGDTAVEYVTWADQTHHFPVAPHVPPEATAATLMWQFFTEHVGAAPPTRAA
jgi:polyhydroxybutyrate depolymerase